MSAKRAIRSVYDTCRTQAKSLEVGSLMQVSEEDCLKQASKHFEVFRQIA